LKIILASGSTIRAELLRRAGLSFDVEIPGIDEQAIKDSLAGSDHAFVTRELAAAKAMAISKPGVLAIGADQTLVFEGQIKSKAANMEEARHVLGQLRGKSHLLISAIACVREGQIVWQHHEAASLTMRDFSDSFADDYIRRCGADVLTSVGGYKIESLGIQLFSHIEGDYTTILGLPLLPLLSFLRQQGHVSS
jgi:septum formation protein